VASNPPSPEKAKTSKNDEKLTILQYLQKKAKTSKSYSFPVSKTSKNSKNFEIWPKLQERGQAMAEPKLREIAKTSKFGPLFRGGEGQPMEPWTALAPVSSCLLSSSA
jgi:hypothetical protein